MFKVIALSLLLAFIAPSILTNPTASAQQGSLGAVTGVVTDKQTGQVVEGATVTITSNTRKNKHTAVTNREGRFAVDSMIPGDYSMIIVYNNAQTVIPSVTITANRTLQASAEINGSSAETVTIKGRTPGPGIDTTETKQGIVLDRNFMKNAPMGRSVDGALKSTPGAVVDSGGNVSFAGSTSSENQYNIDGVNTTNPESSALDTKVSRYFVESLEIVTGGYGADQGRATGGQINAVTRSGSNDFEGSFAIDFTNSYLRLGADNQSRSLYFDNNQNLSYDVAVNATLGGPIIKDKLWFFVGFQPNIVSNNNQRVTKQRTDCHRVLPSGELSDCRPGTEAEGGFSDGVADLDVDGSVVYRTLDTTTSQTQTQGYQFLAKLNFAPNENNSGHVSVLGGPSFGDNIADIGELQASQGRDENNVVDASAQWTSKFNNGNTIVQALAGLHHFSLREGAVNPKANNIIQQSFSGINFINLISGPNQLTGEPRESAITIAGCEDNTPRDEFPDIINCPLTEDRYVVGGIGEVFATTDQRLSGRLSVTQRFEAQGSHVLNAGADIEANSQLIKTQFSGGALIENDTTAIDVSITRYISLANDGNALGAGSYGAQCNRLTNPVACSLTPLDPVANRSVNVAAFVQDTWNPLPNLTANLGLRYEEQRLRTPDHLVGTMDSDDNAIGKNVMMLDGMWAPRLGVIYDWTNQGRSKIYSSWGRYYESLPLQIAGLLFGAEARTQTSLHDPALCGDTSPDGTPLLQELGTVDGRACMTNNNGVDSLVFEIIDGSSGRGLVVDNPSPQFSDEFIVGIDYEIIDGLVLSLAYTNKILRSTLEDISVDEGTTYIVGNPGIWSAADEAKLVTKINNEADPIKKSRLERKLKNFQGIRLFDKARREHNALQASLAAKLSEQISVTANYGFSSTRGNYGSSQAGGFSRLTDAFNSRFTMSNAYGDLAQDRRHQLGIDMIYAVPLPKVGFLTTGLNVRASSGAPASAIGNTSSFFEGFILPRGSLGRGPLQYTASLRTAIEHRFADNLSLSAYAELINAHAFGIFAGQRSSFGDQQYSRTPSGAVVGGRLEDLLYLKALTINGSEKLTPELLPRNSDFNRPETRDGIRDIPAVNIGIALQF